MTIRRSTEYEYRFVGDAQVKQALDNIGIGGSQSLQRLEKASDEVSQSLIKIDRSSRTAQKGFAFLGNQATSLVAGFASVAAITSGVRAATTQLVSFEAELANVGTLGNQSAEALEGFRQGLINTDARLGTTTELTRGLYQTISAGINDDPLEFLRTSATFATAALTDTATAVDVLSTITNAYGETSAKAARNADTLFSTIEQGKTTGEELSRELGQVIPIAASLGVSLEEVTAAIATLTTGGLRTNIATTALRSFFNNLIINAQKFRDVGLDTNKILSSPDGLIRLFERLGQVTGGSSEELRKLVTDTEGLTAALSLSGVQLDSLNEKFDKISSGEGSVLAGFNRRAATAQSAFKELAGEADRLIQIVGPPFLNALTEATRSITGLVNAFRSPDTDNTFVTDIERSLAQVDAVLAERAKNGDQIGERATGLFALPTEELKEEQRLLELLVETLGDARLEVENYGKEAEEAGKDGSQAAARVKEEVEKLNQTQESYAAILRRTKKETEELEKSEQRRLTELVRLIAQSTREQVAEEERARDRIRSLRVRAEREEFRRRVQAEEDLRDAIARIAQRARDEEARAEERAADEAARERLRQLERFDDFVQDTVGSFIDELSDGSDDFLTNLGQGFESLVQDIINRQIFEPLYKSISENITSIFSDAAESGAQAGTRSIPSVSDRPAEGAGGQVASVAGQAGEGSVTQGAGGSFLSAAGGVGRGIGFQGSAQGLFNGGDFTQTAIGQAFSFVGDGTAQNVLGGAGNGVAAGSQFGVYGAIIGGLAGALAGGLGSIFGGNSGSSATLSSTPDRPISTLSDRAQSTGAFGSVGFLQEGTKRFDAAEAADFITDLDDTIALILTDRQEAIVESFLATRNNVKFKNNDQEDLVAEIVFDRIRAIADELGGAGTTERVFGDLNPNSANIGQVTETFAELFTVLSAIDQIENPAETLTLAEAAIRSINEEFDFLVSEAERLGVETRTLERGRAEALGEFTDDFNEQLQRELDAIVDPYGLALRDVAEENENRLAETIAAGGDTALAIALNHERVLEVQEQFAEAQASAAEARLDNLLSLLDNADNLTNAERQLISLGEQFEALADAALDANLPIGEITAAYERAAQQLTSDFDEDIQRRILDFTDPYERQIRELFDRQAQEIREAEALGGNLSEVFRLQRLEQEQLFESFNSAFAGSTGEIEAFLNNLDVSAESGLSATQRLLNAQTQFSAALAGSDENAAVQSASVVLDLLRETRGSTAGFFSGQERVIGLLDDFRDRLIEGGPEQSDFESFLSRFEELQHLENTEQFGGLRETIREQQEADRVQRNEAIQIQRAALNVSESQALTLQESQDLLTSQNVGIGRIAEQISLSVSLQRDALSGMLRAEAERTVA